MKANPLMIQQWAIRDKCWMCRYKFEQSVILPVDEPEHDKFQPKINVEVLYHLYDTHGLPPETVRDWIIGSIYGLELTEFGIRDLSD